MNTSINWHERCVVTGIHLAATAAVAALAATLIFAVWFPGPLAEMAGGRKLFFLVVGIDTALGPLISLVIYNTAKSRRKLIFDYTVVGALQLAALIYGVSMIAISRPLFIVFTVDRLEVVASLEVSDKDLNAANEPRFRSRPLFGPVLATVELPDDAEQSNALMFSAAAGGKDVQMFPQYYRAYETALAQILHHSYSLASLQQKNVAAAKKIKAAIVDADLNENEVRLLAVHSRFGFWTALIDPMSGKPIKYFPIDSDAI
jgi:hypothetical protein